MNRFEQVIARLCSDLLNARGFMLARPIDVEIVYRQRKMGADVRIKLAHPQRADAAKRALLERFGDDLLVVVFDVS